MTGECLLLLQQLLLYAADGGALLQQAMPEGALEAAQASVRSTGSSSSRCSELSTVGDSLPGAGLPYAAYACQLGFDIVRQAESDGSSC